MKTRFFISTVVLFCTTVAVFGASARKRQPTAATGHRQPVPAAGYRVAGRVSFASLDTIAGAVRSIAPANSTDPVLTGTLPRAIRGQCAARLFGPMRAGAHGVAVCYVDPAVAARVAAAAVPTDADLERMKRWTVVYPTALKKADFLRRYARLAQMQPNGVIKLLPGAHSRRTFYVTFPEDGRWAVLAPASSMALDAFRSATYDIGRPLGADLAYLRMDPMGVQALFGSKMSCSGIFSIRMTRGGLEIRGTAYGIEMRRTPLPTGALSFAGIPRGAALFGVSTTPSDVQMAEGIFAMAGPAFGNYIRGALQYVKGSGATGYFLKETMSAQLSPAERLRRILPEAASMPATANAMFCSPTTVIRQSLPKIAARMPPFQTVKMTVAQRLLRGARGDGLGCMSWREGNVDKLLIRISRDELSGTANLWSMLLF